MSAGGRIRFRPHHFLCALGYAGKGYSDSFTRNMTSIVVDRLRAPDGAAAEIEVVPWDDDICAPCPNRRGHLCTAQDKITRLDTAHATALGLAPGDVLRWGEALERIRANVAPGRLDTICAGCEWLQFGLCSAALSELHESERPAG